MQWSERRRLDLAGFLSSMLRAHLNAYDPIFSMTLRYLIRLFLNFIHSVWSGQNKLFLLLCELIPLWNCLSYFYFGFLSFYSIHRAYCLRQGITSPISDLTERLLLEDRDPPATPQDILYEAPPFDEVRCLCCIILSVFCFKLDSNIPSEVGLGI